MNKRKENLEKTINFLNEIGLECEIEPGANGFLSTVRIERGKLFVDPSALAADILHEAGHLAVLPGRFRSIVGKDIGKIQTLIFKTVDFENPDEGEARAALQCGDQEATAWAWAAGKKIGLDDQSIIDGASYAGEGKNIRIMLSTNRYMGINGLAAAKFCVVPPGYLGKHLNLPTYPELKMWLQSDFGMDPVKIPKKASQP